MTSLSRTGRGRLAAAIGGLFVILMSAATTLAQAERLSLSGLKTRIDAVDARLTACEDGVDGACRDVLNIVTVARQGGDFTGIQAAIDSVPIRARPGSSPVEMEVTPTLIRIAPGEYVEQIRPRSNIRLQGAGRNQTLVRPPLVIDACQPRTAVFCLADVDSVSISGIGISGVDPVSGGAAEGAISISRSGDLQFEHLRITDAAYGIFGELVGNVWIRNNHITFPAEPVNLQMSGIPDAFSGEVPVATIAGNRMENGAVVVNSDGRVEIHDNILLGGLNSWRGVLRASGNTIVGDIEFLHLNDSLFNTNNVLGHLRLLGSREVVVVGNRIDGDSFAIEDNGRATIVGNSLAAAGDPVATSVSGSSTIFGNDFVGSAGSMPSHNQLVSSNRIRLESRDEKVTIKAGNSTITVDAAGAISIDSATDINLTSGGKFTVTANGIELKSGVNTLIESAARVDVNAGSSLTAEGAAGAELRSGAITVIQGSLVQIN